LDATETVVEKTVLPRKDLKDEKSRKKRENSEGGKREKGDKRKRKEIEVLADDEEAVDRYPGGTAVTEVYRDAERSSYESNDEDGPSNLVHESLKNKSAKSKTQSGTKTKYAPLGETQQQRDARTIFVGNLPVEVAQKRVGFPFSATFRRFIMSLGCCKATPTPYPQTSSLC
jgi:nucleolar protein 12